MVHRVLPDTVQDVSVWEDSNVDIGYDDVMKMAFAFVGEEQIRHPDLIWIGKRQVLQFTCNIEITLYMYTVKRRPTV